MVQLTEYHLGYHPGIKAWVLFRPAEETATQIYVGSTRAQAIHAAARSLEGSGSYLCIYTEDGQLDQQRLFPLSTRGKEKAVLTGLPPPCRKELAAS
ncbi:DUF2188 domain-containing protein [Brevifollis gellanilyticus]|uniref:Uncharacterized protein n=1 Tax=Brevifollis gellanilyticus TaxID=748831 RepID=A0A512M5G2_9BACT|nr:DUF2188 domain-containing protein [Brevifollis gellanilyticus]GEP41975.1 hypothetical protein BGE01nite_12660 [Brevifollis gellanilyticus]